MIGFGQRDRMLAQKRPQPFGPIDQSSSDARERDEEELSWEALIGHLSLVKDTIHLRRRPQRMPIVRKAGDRYPQPFQAGQEPFFACECVVNAHLPYKCCLSRLPAVSPSFAPFFESWVDPCLTTGRYASMGIGNLATNLGNQEKILNEGALQPLISLARRENGDLESQRYAVFALTNVAASTGNHARMINAGACDLAASLLEADDVEIRNSAAFCVANFASNADNHGTLLDEGVLGPLIAMLASSDPQVGMTGSECFELRIVEVACIDARKGQSWDPRSHRSIGLYMLLWRRVLRR